jgi:hypothetical protein
MLWKFQGEEMMGNRLANDHLLRYKMLKKVGWQSNQSGRKPHWELEHNLMAH